MSYHAPIKDMLFNMQHLAHIEQVAQIPGFEDAGLDTAAAVLEECAKFTEGVLAPLNFEGDKNPSIAGQVTKPAECLRSTTSCATKAALSTRTPQPASTQGQRRRTSLRRR